MFSRFQPTHADRRYVPPPPTPTYVGDTRFAPLLVSQAAVRPVYSTVKEYNKLFFLLLFYISLGSGASGTFRWRVYWYLNLQQWFCEQQSFVVVAMVKYQPRTVRSEEKGWNRFSFVTLSALTVVDSKPLCFSIPVLTWQIHCLLLTN